MKSCMKNAYQKDLFTYYLSLTVISSNTYPSTCTTCELTGFCMSVHCLSEWVRWLEKKRLSLLISQPAPGLWGLFSPRVLLLARFLPPCHRQRPVLLTWVEAWPVPFWQSALGSHEDLGTAVFNVEIPPLSMETFFFFFWQAPLGHVTHMKIPLKRSDFNGGVFVSLPCVIAVAIITMT